MVLPTMKACADVARRQRAMVFMLLLLLILDLWQTRRIFVLEKEEINGSIEITFHNIFSLNYWK
jgi:hypothetical protein